MNRRPTTDEMDDVLGQCVDGLSSGSSKYPALCYEDGVAAALEWVIGKGENPLSE
jgi:hypothetical protein